MDTFQIDRVKKLLGKITSLKEREREISILKDEHFNIFKVLRLSNSEVGLHSRFIFELLNPNGTHLKGDVFLRIFIQMLENKFNIEEFGSLDNFKVIEAKNEKHLGLVDYDLEEGGSLDIYIETSDFIIGIENKIYAGLGYKQLERYSNYLKTFQKSTFLLYLSLYGDIVNNKGLKNSKDYFVISYTDFIIPWLKLCHQYASDSPLIRETLKQYINIIKELTGQLTNHKMDKELENLLLENYDAALTIAKAFENVKILKTRKIYKELEKKLNESLEGSEYFPVRIDQEILDKSWNGFSVKKKNWVDGLEVYFEGFKKLMDGFTHGFMFSNCDENTFLSKVNGKIKLKKVWQPNEGNLWINQENGRYRSLSVLLEKNDDISELAEELKDYVLSIVSKLEPDANRITEVFKK